MREEMDGKLFFPVRVGISAFDVVFCKSTFPYLYLDLACKQLSFPPKEKIEYEK